MRPDSIVKFERLFLASLVLSAIATILAYDTMVAEMTRDPAVQELGLGSGFMISLLLISFAIFLLLWYLIARRGSSIAKWILVVFVAFGVVSFLATLAASFTLDATTLLGLVTYVLEVAAVWYLFRPDAAAWFRGDAKTDPRTFD